ncbi:uncharacterized protein LOC126291499 [Schistocerca gregaria]|uniref:uncharacterized protein LOC126291499 n=1 Tax=Schistocerca gregaria TaxID=7010 RepID=UPI00211E3D34|nr:uncharacterized protein LOC126291499 [Schistocerca gregaria]
MTSDIRRPPAPGRSGRGSSQDDRQGGAAGESADMSAARLRSPKGLLVAASEDDEELTSTPRCELQPRDIAERGPDDTTGRIRGQVSAIVSEGDESDDLVAKSDARHLAQHLAGINLGQKSQIHSQDSETKLPLQSQGICGTKTKLLDKKQDFAERDVLNVSKSPLTQSRPLGKEAEQSTSEKRSGIVLPKLNVETKAKDHSISLATLMEEEADSNRNLVSPQVEVIIHEDTTGPSEELEDWAVITGRERKCSEEESGRMAPHRISPSFSGWQADSGEDTPIVSPLLSRRDSRMTGDTDSVSTRSSISSEPLLSSRTMGDVDSLSTRSSISSEPAMTSSVTASSRSSRGSLELGSEHYGGLLLTPSDFSSTDDGASDCSGLTVDLQHRTSLDDSIPMTSPKDWGFLEEVGSRMVNPLLHTMPGRFFHSLDQDCGASLPGGWCASDESTTSGFMSASVTSSELSSSRPKTSWRSSSGGELLLAVDRRLSTDDTASTLSPPVGWSASDEPLCGPSGVSSSGENAGNKVGQEDTTEAMGRQRRHAASDEERPELGSTSAEECSSERDRPVMTIDQSGGNKDAITSRRKQSAPTAPPSGAGSEATSRKERRLPPIAPKSGRPQPLRRFSAGPMQRTYSEVCSQKPPVRLSARRQTLAYAGGTGFAEDRADAATGGDGRGSAPFVGQVRSGRKISSGTIGAGRGQRSAQAPQRRIREEGPPVAEPPSDTKAADGSGGFASAGSPEVVRRGEPPACRTRAAVALTMPPPGAEESPDSPPPPGDWPGGPRCPSPLHGSSRPRSLMESLLLAKMERASAPGAGGGLLRRMDSTDSATSSLSSSSAAGPDVCRCDDCLLGIADLYASSPAEDARRRKKVTLISHN